MNLPLIRLGMNPENCCFMADAPVDSNIIPSRELNLLRKLDVADGTLLALSTSDPGFCKRYGGRRA